MKTITIRVDDELYEEIEKARGDKSKSDFYRDALKEYISKEKDETTNTNEYTLLLEKDNEYLKKKVDELLTLLNQEQTLHLQTQGRLPGKVEEAAEGKSWWQFWK